MSIRINKADDEEENNEVPQDDEEGGQRFQRQAERRSTIQRLKEMFGSKTQDNGAKIQDQVDAFEKDDGLENGRRTKFYYEKYRTLEICRFQMMLMSWGLNILGYDLEFRETDKATQLTISYILLFTSIVLIILTYYVFTTHIEWMIESKQLDKRANVFNTDIWREMVFEQLLFVIFPYPWTQGIRVTMFNNFQQRSIYYSVNDFLTLIMLLRIVNIVKILMVLTPYAGSRTNRICGLYACEYDQMFIIKILMKKNPLEVVSTCYLTSIFLFGFAIRICERPLVRPDDPWYTEYGGYPNYCCKVVDGEEVLRQETQDYDQFLIALWNIFITLPTIGYGDTFPRTILGRAVMTVCAITGSFLVSILVSAFTQILDLSNLESRSLVIIQRLHIKEKIKQFSARLVSISLKLHKKRDQENYIEKKIELLKEMKQNVKKQALLNSEYRSIEDTGGLFEELEQCFKYTKDNFEDISKENYKLFRTYDIIYQKYDIPEEFTPEEIQLFEELKRNSKSKNLKFSIVDKLI